MRRFTVVERARLLRAISTQSRMQIIEVLKQGPLDVGELAEKLGISQSAVSQHLKVLKGFDLVTDERHS
ncbi:metalloregulator ArsR/SmtB family transcription factor, partial [candidate division WOR-3 bacterium]|nr:metalloregulator ArsR/SmtB family transcription factor [candidate division WOR-3 bacterium]MBD3364190.1 metalloregulator ArsR/SmtB family transcription factor [candidate division WOR-3 bacterium]